MDDTADMPRELQVALSYLDDIDGQIERRVKSKTDNVLIRAQAAQEIQKGDLALAHRELDKLATQGVEVKPARSMVFFKEGLLAYAVATSGGPETGDQTRWLNKAAEAFQKSINEAPDAETYFNLGLVYKILKRKSSALEAFQQAEQSSDPELSLKARKEIGRLDPDGRMQGATTAPASSRSGGFAVAGPSKKPHWGFIGWGIGSILFAWIHPFLFFSGAGLIAWGVFKGKPD